MKKILAGLGLLAAVATAAGPAGAETAAEFPSKPITIVVSLAAGGPSDTVCRILGEELSKIWKQQVVIENKAGGGTFIGNTYAARAKPDGYTWLHASASFLISPATRSDVPYDTQRDFTPISVIVQAPLAMVAHPGLAANNLPELIALAKTRTDQPLMFSSSGIASNSHMAGEMLQQVAGIKLRHIPYPGQGANMTDTMAGRVDFQIGTWSTQRPYVESGKLKLISVLYPRRLDEAANVATIHEVVKGMDNGALDVFNSIVVPSGVPDDIKAKISEGIKAATATDSYKQRILATGSYPHYTSLAESAEFFRRVGENWIKIAKETNIKIN